MRSRGPVFALSMVLLTFFLLNASSFAIPALSRQYGTSCTTCPGMRASNSTYYQTPVGAPGTVPTPDIPRTEQRSERQKGDSR
jgi:hypothetical protein